MIEQAPRKFHDYKIHICIINYLSLATLKISCNNNLKYESKSLFKEVKENKYKNLKMASFPFQ